MHSPDWPLLFVPGHPAVMMKHLVSEAHSVNAQKLNAIHMDPHKMLIIQVKLCAQVCITFDPGFPGKPSSPSLPKPPCKANGFIYQHIRTVPQ